MSWFKIDLMDILRNEFPEQFPQVFNKPFVLSFLIGDEIMTQKTDWKGLDRLWVEFKNRWP